MKNNNKNGRYGDFDDFEDLETDVQDGDFDDFQVDIDDYEDGEYNDSFDDLEEDVESDRSYALMAGTDRHELAESRGRELMVSEDDDDDYGELDEYEEEMEYEDEDSEDFDGEELEDDFENSFKVDLSDIDLDDDRLPEVYNGKGSSLKKKGTGLAKRNSDADDFDDDDEEASKYYGYSEDDDENDGKKSHLGLKIFGIIFLLLIVFVAFLIITTPGRSIMYKLAAKFIYSSVNTDPINVDIEPTLSDEFIKSLDEDVNPDADVSIVDLEDPFKDTNDSPYRHEDYVKTYLLFGIEEIDGASNTDSIMLVSTNTKDNSIKLTSILRDTYVDIPGYYPNKINAAYAYGCKTGETSDERKANGAKMLVSIIENTYDVDISGYAYVNFKGLENVIDRLGGIDIELGKAEAAYLCKTNYISNPAYRTVSAGWNHLNGNQALGYCRVRKVVTLGGANNDYGRTVRQRRVINAIVQQYKNSALTDLIPILRDCLAYVKTNLTEEQISDALYDVIENQTFTVNQMRLPADELFRDSGKKGVFNGKYNVTYTLVLDGYREQNIKKFHEFLFLDSPEDSAAADSAAAGATE